jgi:hypothetical protein
MNPILHNPKNLIPILTNSDQLHQIPILNSQQPQYLHLVHPCKHHPQYLFEERRINSKSFNQQGDSYPIHVLGKSGNFVNSSVVKPVTSETEQNCFLGSTMNNIPKQISPQYQVNGDYQQILFH